MEDQILDVSKRSRIAKNVAASNTAKRESARYRDIVTKGALISLGVGLAVVTGSMFFLSFDAQIEQAIRVGITWPFVLPLLVDSSVFLSGFGMIYSSVTEDEKSKILFRRIFTGIGIVSLYILNASSIETIFSTGMSHLTFLEIVVHSLPVVIIEGVVHVTGLVFSNRISLLDTRSLALREKAERQQVSLNKDLERAEKAGIIAEKAAEKERALAEAAENEKERAEKEKVEREARSLAEKERAAAESPRAARENLSVEKRVSTRRANSPSVSDAQLLQSIVEFIRAGLSVPITNGILAEHFSLGQSTLYKKLAILKKENAPILKKNGEWLYDDERNI